ncbi:MAG: N-6 DNA methylase [Candidatus Heimdallarchaeota archaeon]|nr:N-6 DNA methylase [Candidatus Heimdallarchaeota archaeon]MCK5143282.1 N-6 DNA methylase [Candidatus Heimdallarchaeota archaeon]
MHTEESTNILETYVNHLQNIGLNHQESYSIVLKFWVMVNSEFIKIIEDNKTISLLNIYSSNNFHLSDFVSLFEYYKVSKVLLEKVLVENLCAFLANIDIGFLLSTIKDLKSRKAIGQYFTNPEMIDQVYRNITNNPRLQRKFSVMDFSAGLGYFLKPFLKDNCDIYGVELDPLVYELMLFSFLFHPSLTNNVKTRLMLTVKQGDSLIGFKEKTIDEIFSKSILKANFLEYISLRNKILTIDREIDLNDLKEYYERRNLFAEGAKHFRSFNWVVDFPELFFDQKGNLLEEIGVDYVVGNPPWIYYKDVDEKQYKKDILDPRISNFLRGKYNFSLPFVILAHIISKEKGSLVVPQGILTETYAKEWRKEVFTKRAISEITLCKKDWFEEVINEFSIIFWDKRSKFSEINLRNERTASEFTIPYDSIDLDLNLLRLLPPNILFYLKKIEAESPILSDFISIRRGLTLSKDYQNKYKNKEIKTETSNHVKKLLRSNSFLKNKENGVFNFQLSHSGEIFVYDKKLLGAPGSEQLFEQSKIIRRNRGKIWYIGLDLNGDYYVNDIFDIMYSKKEQISIKIIYGYLCSSFIQLIAESLLVRDITSNVVRQFPFPRFNFEQISKIEKSVDRWLFSQRTENDFSKMRKEVDEIVFNHWRFPDEIRKYFDNNTHLRWKE